MQNVTGKVAFVTGGASGIGLGIARSLAGAGMKVAIADVEQAALDRVQAEFGDTNTELIFLQVDVTQRDSLEAAAEATESAFGKIHVVCNNAGVAVSGPIHQMSYQDWDWVMGVNLDGVINGVQTFVNRIKAHGEGGHFINTASMAGQMPIVGGIIYGTSKYAVVGLSEIMRMDLAQHNIGVSVLCPGGVITNAADSGRNRPNAFEAKADTSQLGMEGELAAMVLAAMLEPDVIGDMVLDAIMNDDEYIFSHPNLKQVVDRRTAAMDASFERWSRYRQERNV